jgi:hypothetical protein
MLAVRDSRYDLTAQRRAHTVNPKATRSNNAFIDVRKGENVGTGFDVGGGDIVAEDDGVVSIPATAAGGCAAAGDSGIVGGESTGTEDAEMMGIPETVVAFPTVGDCVAAVDAAEDDATATIGMEEEPYDVKK